MKLMREPGGPRAAGPALLLACAAALAGCGDDDPTAVGAPLFPPGAVRTFEVVLDAPAFLVADSSYNGFDEPGGSGLLVVAEDYAGVLDAHTLASFGALPTTVTFRDTAGTARTDTVPRFTGGRIVFALDSASALGTAPAELAAYTVAESWHAPTATWELRADTAAQGRVPWEVPGGTPGRLIGTGTWTAGADSVVIPLDSAELVALRDSATTANGIMLVSRTSGVRLHGRSIVLRVEARPSPRPDTLIVTSLSPLRSTFLFDPKPPATDLLRAGGTPGWRAALELSPALDTLTLPCPAPAPAGCRLRLRDATVTAAELLLQPLEPPAGFMPEDSVWLQLWPVLRSPLVPLPRSPLRDLVSGSTTAVPPASFQAPAGGAARVAIPFTPYFRELVAERDTAADPPTRTIALIGQPLRRTFGFAVFGSAEAGARAPRLRLVLTVPEEVVRR